jgi:DNA mismatch repair protein MSH6
MDTKSQKSFKSASSRSGSSRRSAISDDESEEEPVKKSKSKSTAKKATSDKSAPVATSGNRSFLTAAEQRTQDKKNEKKEGESPYAFLADIRDVLISLAPLYNAHRLCNSRKMEIAPTILNMI